ncbi:MAG: sigma-70 family RNA polymerase sigma factor [Solirubrobacterales bacterium]
MSSPASGANSGAGGPGLSRLLSDDRLVRRATKGDRRAFEAIYERYHQDLYRFCLAMVRRPQDAQDALQDTMVKVLRALPGETRDIHLKPWLYRIARNEAIETIRRRRDSVELEDDHLATTPAVAETAEARERLRKLIGDLEELPERQRAALVMRELGGLGFAQIAETFETSPAVARQTVYEARVSLRQMEEGREMGCADVTRELSDGDGRVIRRRGVRAHLRGCPNCRAFQQSIAGRHSDLAAIAPLPLAASAGLLHTLLTGQASGAVGAGAAGLGGGAGVGGGLAGTVGAGAGKVVATSAIVKAAATVAVVAVVGVSAADRSGVIDVGLPGGSTTPTESSPASAGKGAAQQTSNSAQQGSTETPPPAGAATNPAVKGRPEGSRGPGSNAHATNPNSAKPNQAQHGSSANPHSNGRTEAHGGTRSHGEAAAAGHGTKSKQSTHRSHQKSPLHSHSASHSHRGSRNTHATHPPKQPATHSAPSPSPPPPAPSPPQHEPAPIPPASTESEPAPSEP